MGVKPGSIEYTEFVIDQSWPTPGPGPAGGKGDAIIYTGEFIICPLGGIAPFIGGDRGPAPAKGGSDWIKEPGNGI